MEVEERIQNWGERRKKVRTIQRNIEWGVKEGFRGGKGRDTGPPKPEKKIKRTNQTNGWMGRSEEGDGGRKGGRERKRERKRGRSEDEARTPLAG